MRGKDRSLRKNSDRETDEVGVGMRYAENYRKLKNALESTAGQVLFYEDGLAMTPFFNLSNGYTRMRKRFLKGGVSLSEDCGMPGGCEGRR